MDTGSIALMSSCQNGHELCARALLEAKADPNAENDNHVTALNLACEDKHEQCALLLLRAGAKPDIKDAWGDSPRKIAKKKKMKGVLALM